VSTTSSNSNAQSPLARFPQEVQAAYERFLAAPSPGDLQIVVQAALRDFMPKRNALPATVPLTEELRLVEDLGFDSLAVAETVFFFEDLFNVTIQTQEILSLRTVGELQEFVGRKLAAAAPSA
jgi:acyl carrier protein